MQKESNLQQRVRKLEEMIFAIANWVPNLQSSSYYPRVLSAKGCAVFAKENGLPDISEKIYAKVLKAHDNHLTLGEDFETLRKIAEEIDHMKKALKFEILFELSQNHLRKDDRIEEKVIEYIKQYATENKIESLLPYALKEAIGILMEYGKTGASNAIERIIDATDLYILAKKHGIKIPGYTERGLFLRVEKRRRRKR